MRTHGWGGDPPATDAEAISRILASVDRCITTFGANTTIADVASDLGVSRQTVYRYFSSTEALLIAAAVNGTADFLARLKRRLRPISDPGEALVEAVAYTIDRAPHEPYLALLMSGTTHSLVRSVTSDAARGIGRQLLDHTSVAWDELPLTPNDLDDLIEWTLRTVQTFLLDPSHPPRKPAQLRQFLREWLAPAVKAKVTAGVVRGRAKQTVS